MYNKLIHRLRKGRIPVIGDLHCHTRLSDGSLGIEEVIALAKKSGLDFLSITDHDTLDGNTRAEVLGNRYGIGIIHGVELSAYDYTRGRKVHILCYRSKKPARLEGLCTKTRENRKRAGNEMARKVMRYYPITPEMLAKYASGSKCIFKQHIMNALYDIGYADGFFGEVYHTLFAEEGGSCLVQPEYPDVREVLSLVRDSGGISVLAHPGVYDSLDLLEELAKKGLIDGAEQSHPRNTPEVSRQVEDICRQYQLIATGGTDFHGMYTPRPNPLGSHITTQESLDRIFSHQAENLG